MEPLTLECSSGLSRCWPVIGRSSWARIPLIFLRLQEAIPMGQALSTKAPAPLVPAALVGDVAEVKRLLAEGTDVAAVDGEGNHGLGAACCQGSAEVVDLLLAAGAPVNKANKMGAKIVA